MTTNKYVFKLSLSRREAPALSGAFAASPLLPSFGFTTTAHAQSSKESTITIVDELEREVRLRAPVKAVYPDLRYQTEIVRAIGADDTIVAIEQTSNPNKNPANKDYFAKLADLPDAGNFNGPNWERLPHRARKSSLPAAPPWFCRSPRPAISMQGRSSWPASRSRSSSARSPPESSILPRTKCWPRSCAGHGGGQQFRLVSGSLSLPASGTRFPYIRLRSSGRGNPDQRSAQTANVQGRRSRFGVFRDLIESGEVRTVRDLIIYHSSGGGHWFPIGSVETSPTSCRIVTSGVRRTGSTSWPSR